jgi:ketosteroid isomerase-like protein
MGLSAALSAGDQALIEWELVKLNTSFAYFMDHGEFEAMLELFTADALFDRAGNIHRGHEEIRDAMRVRPKMTARHQLTNFHFFDVTDDSAEAVVCAMVYHGPPQDDGKPAEYEITECRLMEFRDSYRRTADGWRIASRAGTAILVPRKRS